MATAAIASVPERMSSIGRFYPSSKLIRSPRLVRNSVSIATRCQIDLKHHLEKSIYKSELEAAIEIVERACRLCISVQAGLKPSEDKHAQNMKMEKSDASPVTVADLGVQALVSLGLVTALYVELTQSTSSCSCKGNLGDCFLTHLLGVELGLRFPSIPLMGEEDSKQLREDLSNYQKRTQSTQDQPLIDIVTQAVSSVASVSLENVTTESILNALDRGVKSIPETDSTRISYWILDPIDGTRGFLKGGDALYVVGLALVVQGEVVLGVMGCPNAHFKYIDKFASGEPFSLQMAMSQQSCNESTAESCEVVRPPLPRGFQSGLLMAACSGCGCWARVLSRNLFISDQKDSRQSKFQDMMELKVDGSMSTKEALFCISDNEEWTTLPLANALASEAAGKDRLPEYEAKVLSLCCGSLCKYFAVALGGVSVFVQHVKGPVKVWDHAAGVICVVEAGGQVTDFEGSLLQMTLGNGEQRVTPRGGIVACNGSLHSIILRSVSPSEMSFR